MDRHGLRGFGGPAAAAPSVKAVMVEALAAACLLNLVAYPRARLPRAGCRWWRAYCSGRGTPSARVMEPHGPQSAALAGIVLRNLSAWALREQQAAEGSSSRAPFGQPRRPPVPASSESSPLTPFPTLNMRPLQRPTGGTWWRWERQGPARGPPPARARHQGPPCALGALGLLPDCRAAFGTAGTTLLFELLRRHHDDPALVRLGLAAPDRASPVTGPVVGALREHMAAPGAVQEALAILGAITGTEGEVAKSPGIGVLLNSNPSVPNFVMMHAEIKRNDDPFLRFLNRDISEKHLRYTDLDSDFKVLTQKMLPELAKLFGYITVHKQRVVSRALLKTIVEMLGSLEREMLVSSMTDFFYQVLGSVTWHAGQSDLESISSESPPSPKSLSGSKKGRAANPLRSPLCTPAVPAPFGNPFAHQPAAPTAPSTPVPDPVVAKPPASSRTPAPASAKGGEPGGKKSIAPAVGALPLLSLLLCPLVAKADGAAAVVAAIRQHGPQSAASSSATSPLVVLCQLRCWTPLLLAKRWPLPLVRPIQLLRPEALFAAWKRQRTSTTNVGVTPCGRSLVLEVRGPVERAVTRPVKVPVRSASREVEVRWRLAPSAAKKTEDLGWRSGRSEMELEVALQAALDEGTIADASAVKWDSGMVFAAPADLVSLKVALFRMEKREKARPAFIGGKAPAAKLASVFEGFDHPAAVTPASARPLVTSPTPSVPVTPTLATPGTGQAMQPEDGAAKSAPGEKGTAAAKTASATDTAKSKKRKPSPSGERRSSHSHHHTHAHGHGSSHR
ncbi:hypothetical protein PAPYR_13299 [Paratrimastix pyriformis]|uniref:Uncharacterized protein n=1 Tax=Paratrimastix pyriformis TaxID=342808 RepID=A0ABQ8U0F3_9EUKA|nr:hypothetical protein PAPYR_13299 [Paratrimastix pyriformis]